MRFESGVATVSSDEGTSSARITPILLVSSSYGRLGEPRARRFCVALLAAAFSAGACQQPAKRTTARSPAPLASGTERGSSGGSADLTRVAKPISGGSTSAGRVPRLDQVSAMRHVDGRLAAWMKSPPDTGNNFACAVASAARVRARVRSSSTAGAFATASPSSITSSRCSRAARRPGASGAASCRPSRSSVTRTPASRR